MSNKKVVLITNIPNQYRVPLFNELNKQLNKKGIALMVIFGSSAYQQRKSIVEKSEFDFPYKILKSEKFNSFQAKGNFIYSNLFSELRKQKANLIIVAGFSMATLKIWIRSWLVSTPYIIWSGSIDNGKKKMNALKNWARKVFVKRATAYFSYGSLAKEYFIQLGGKSDKVFPIGNTVDVNFFKEKSFQLRNSIVKDNKKHLTYLGYITPRKNVEQLIYLMDELLKYRQDFVLDIIGDGESRLLVEKLVQQKKLSKYVSFHGFKQKQEIPAFLAQSSCLLFQTNYDIWGLVLNEAMAASVPCFASVNAGATEDIIIEGETGFKVDFSKHEEVAEKLHQFLDQTEEMKRIGENASDFIATQYSIERCAQKMAQHIENDL